MKLPKTWKLWFVKEEMPKLTVAKDLCCTNVHVYEYMSLDRKTHALERENL